MKNKLHLVKSFVTYWLDAVDEHSLHSPFLFDFYTNVLRPPFAKAPVPHIEARRKKLSADHRPIDMVDFGSGSSVQSGRTRRISSIARTTLTPAKFALLFCRIIQHYRCRNILELGTALGINTLYLASSDESHVYTLEGSRELAAQAQAGFDAAGAKNITLVTGDINDTLGPLLQVTDSIDFAYIDANHRYTPTLSYFNALLARMHEQSVLVLDDIHYTAGMEKAWEEIKKDSRVYATVDLFQCGIVFLNPALSRQHVVLQF